MRVAPEGWPFIVAALVICVALAWFRLWVPLAAWGLITLWVVAFFRDPARPGPRGEGLVIAPADGKVVSVIPIEEPAFLGGPSTRVSIFMNVFNVHVNRYPVDGTIGYQAYVPGKFINAAEEKAARENEQSSVGIASARGPVLVRQIAGLVARRIVTDHERGTSVRQGERMGLIRFGSRVDVFLPPGTRITVKAGDRTKAGQTIIAEWP
jgi:phosphatidylserine decarboxylase